MRCFCKSRLSDVIHLRRDYRRCAAAAANLAKQMQHASWSWEKNTHLKGTHSTTQLVEKEVRLATARESRVSLPANQPKLDFSREPRVTLEELNQLVAGYIVEEMLPLSTVDSSSFRRIIDKIPSNNNVHLPHRKSFTSYLENEYKKMKAALKLALDDVQFVSTTADIWTANNRSYMGVTIHWFNQDTLERHKAALACKRVRGRHTFDVIAAELEQIHSSFGLLNKVVATVTDNASNFVKAFKTFPPPESDEDEKEEEEEEEQEDVLFTDIAEALTSVSDEGHITLPPHYRCASHTINLISTSDVEKYLKSSPTTKSVYRVTIAKCTALWTKASRSTVAAEQVQEVSQRKLLVPSSTRWKSFYDAVSRVAEIPMNELNNLCNKLGIKCFNEKEYQFMHEYCIAMKPLTAALDILQGDECPYGALLPTLEILMMKSLSLKDLLTKMTADLPDVIVKVCMIQNHKKEVFPLLVNRIPKLRIDLGDVVHRLPFPGFSLILSSGRAWDNVCLSVLGFAVFQGVVSVHIKVSVTVCCALLDTTCGKTRSCEEKIQPLKCCCRHSRKKQTQRR
uniref:HAT C-terminal dimerisation domain-containing protein n=1 Tax=Oryzias latipes TaxID=8090 RepID=A0A3P9IQU6_ORYLA